MEYTPSNRGALCISARLHIEDTLAKYEVISKCIDELSIVREAMINGTYDHNLHCVVNANESLQELIGSHLPAPTNGDNNKTLMNEYVKHIDVAMEGLLEELARLIEALWKAFCSYVSDYLVAIKRYRIKIAKYRAQWQMNRTFLGTKKEFEALSIVTYPYKDWEILVDESSKLSAVLDTMRPQNVMVWMGKNKEQLAKTLIEFGINVEVTEEDGVVKHVSISKGAVRHQKVEGSLKNLRWIHESMDTYFDKVLKLLDETIKDMDANKTIEQAYKVAKKEVATAKGNATEEAKTAKDSLKLAIDIFKIHRDNVAGVSRAFIMLVEAAINNAKA